MPGVMRKLGKLERATFGAKDGRLGLWVVIKGDGWGVQDCWTEWDCEWTDHCKWTHEERISGLGKIVWRLNDILRAAKVTTVDRLVGKPVEATFEGNTLVDWRILTEVL